MERSIARVVTLPPPSPGFMGAGHTAIEVLQPDELTTSDPFVLLMDDRLDLGPVPRQMGGAHPHAGLETVTLFLAGTMADRDEGDTVAGDAQWMTAGRGVIHSENIVAGGSLRILQLWIRLPKAARDVPPAVQLLRLRDLPIRREAGAEVRIYSGASGGIVSPTTNHAPVTLVDIHLQAGASIEQDLPSSYSGFAYVIEGAVEIGGERTKARVGQVAWLDRVAQSTSVPSTLRFTARGEAGARIVLYSGEPQNEPLIHHGPFVAGSESDIRRLFFEFRAGRFTRLSEIMKGAPA